MEEVTIINAKYQVLFIVVYLEARLAAINESSSVKKKMAIPIMKGLLINRFNVNILGNADRI